METYRNYYKIEDWTLNIGIFYIDVAERKNAKRLLEVDMRKELKTDVKFPN